MKEKSIILGYGRPAERERMKTALERKGYRVYPCNDTGEVMRSTRRLRPDLVLLEFGLMGDNARGLAAVIEKDLISSVVFIIDQPDPGFIRLLEDMNVYAYVTPAMPLEAFYKTIEISIPNARRIMDLKIKVFEAERKLASRILVEKAKGILMKEKGMTEEEAFAWIRKKSMDACISLDRTCEVLIETYRPSGK